MEISNLNSGSKQTKLRSNKSEYVLPSCYLNQVDMPMSVGGSTANNNLHIYSVPFSDDKCAWGRDIGDLHLGEYLADAVMCGGRYNSEAFKPLADFALGLLVNDLKTANSQVLEIVITVGLPTGDCADHGRPRSLLKVLEGQHQVTTDDQVVVVRVRKVYTLPQPTDTLYNELLDSQDFIKNKTLLDEKVGIVNIGGSATLIDAILDFKLSGKDRQRFNTGVNNLCEVTASRIEGDVSLYQLGKELHHGNQQH